MLGASPAALFGQLLTPQALGLPGPACDGQGRVTHLAAWHHWLSDLGERQLERRFYAAHGQSLRAYRPQARCSRLLMQVARLHLGNEAAPPIAWADLAAQAGYADQAHLCRDVLRYTGHRPSALLQGLRQHDPDLWPFHVSPVTTHRWFGTAGY